MSTTEIRPDAVGVRTQRLDAPAKVTGAARYAADVPVIGLLHARPVLSPYAHARIVSVDADRARGISGVVAVLTAADLPITSGMGSRAFEPLARTEAVFAGQPVALVVAESEAAAQDGAEAVVIDYEPLPAAVDLERAIEPGAPLTRVEGGEAATEIEMHTEVAESSAGGETGPVSANVIGRYYHAEGDLDSAFASCAAVVGGRFRTQWVHQAYLEPQAAVAWVDLEGRLVVHASTQGHFFVRGVLSRALGLPLQKIRVVGETLGGAFGGKIGLIEPLVAAAAIVLRRPVRLVLTRSEDFAAANPAPACVIDLRIGARADGTLAALDGRILVDAGAFSEYGGAALSSGRIGGPYRWGAWKVTTLGVTTNRFGAGAYRAPSAPQTAFALESLVDDLATQLGMDPVDLRLQNVPDQGDLRIDGMRWPRIGLRQTLEAARTHPLWARRGDLPPGEGVGFAAGLFPGGRQGAGAVCRLETDGSLLVNIGAIDMSGTSTGLQAIAAETFGVPVEKVTVLTPDTDSAPPAVLSGGSMVTYSVGPAVAAAAAEAREKLLQAASQ
jgi:CO/xanthine dehydrogenase Mo-binding subunit